MKKLLKALAIAGSLMVPAHASNQDFGVPISIHALGSSGLILFYSEAWRSATPACVTTANQKAWMFSVATPGGQAMLSTLLTAKAQGKGVWVGGSGTCSLWSDRETADWIVIAD